MAEVFKVVIDGLSREQHDAVNAAIQRAVVSRLAGRDLRGGDDKAVLLSDWRLAGYVALAGRAAIQADLAQRAGGAKLPDDELGRFEVKIDGLDLGKPDRAAIAADIQRAVLPQIAALDFGGGRVPTAVLRPRDWMGLIAVPIDLERLAEFGV
jgi:hypothetical protein